MWWGVPGKSVLLPYFPGTSHPNQYYCHISTNTPPQSVLLPYFPENPTTISITAIFSQERPATISITAIFSRKTPPQSVLLPYFPENPPQYGSNTDCGGVFLENMAVILIVVGFLENMAVILIVVDVPGKYDSNTDCGGVFPGKYGSNADWGGVFLENMAVIPIVVGCSWQICQ